MGREPNSGGADVSGGCDRIGHLGIGHPGAAGRRRKFLLAIRPGPRLAGLFGVPTLDPGAIVYGRVADILLNGRPAVELLEVVAPG